MLRRTQRIYSKCKHKRRHTQFVCRHARTLSTKTDTLKPDDIMAATLKSADTTTPVVPEPPKLPLAGVQQKPKKPQEPQKPPPLNTQGEGRSKAEREFLELWKMSKASELGRNKPSSVLFESRESTKTNNMINTITTALSFPLHAWGFYHVDTVLILPVFTFSCLWAMYSYFRSRNVVYRVTLSPGHKEIIITTLSVFGTEKSDTFGRHQLAMNMEYFTMEERKKRLYFNVLEKGSINKINRKFVIELDKGSVKDQNNFNKVFLMGKLE